VNPLERRYRAVLRAYPRAFVAERGAELIGTLLMAARPDQVWPEPRQVRALLLGGLRARLRADRRPDGAWWREATFLAVLLLSAQSLLLPSLDAVSATPGPRAVVVGLLAAAQLLALLERWYLAAAVLTPAVAIPSVLAGSDQLMRWLDVAEVGTLTLWVVALAVARPAPALRRIPRTASILVLGFVLGVRVGGLGFPPLLSWLALAGVGLGLLGAVVVDARVLPALGLAVVTMVLPTAVAVAVTGVSTRAAVLGLAAVAVGGLFVLGGWWAGRRTAPI
jgi:hypothetical protein